MSNFFLLNESLSSQNYKEFKMGLTELALINKLDNDIFFKHESIWNSTEFIEQLFLNYNSQEERFISEFLMKVTPSENYYNEIEKFNSVFQYDDNGFLGINFDCLNIEKVRQVKNQKDYDLFKLHFLWQNVNFRNFWSKRIDLFPNLVFCGAVESQISLVGNSSYFTQIIEKLRILDSALNCWKLGSFSYKQITTDFPLNISPESEGTLKKYGSERRFNLPSGESKIFDLHIKTGDLRFHFYPDNANRKIYVGYIGPHLSTISN